MPQYPAMLLQGRRKVSCRRLGQALVGSGFTSAELKDAWEGPTPAVLKRKSSGKAATSEQGIHLVTSQMGRKAFEAGARDAVLSAELFLQAGAWPEGLTSGVGKGPVLLLPGTQGISGQNRKLDVSSMAVQSDSGAKDHELTCLFVMHSVHVCQK